MKLIALAMNVNSIDFNR